MNAVFNAALPVFALILTGWIAARCRVLGASATEALNRYVVYLSLPVLLFRAMATTRPDQLVDAGFVGAFSGGAAAAFAAAWWAGTRHGADRGIRILDGLTAAYANAGYMGLPLCLALLGPGSLPPAIVAMLLTACALFGITIAMMEFETHKSRHPLRTLGKVAWALARNPLLASPVLGLAWACTGVPLPSGIDRYTELLGASASPCALVTIGLFLAQTRTGGQTAAVVRLVAAKLLLQPAATALLAFQVFSMPPVWAWSAVLMSALPIGTGPFMLAQLYGRDAGLAARAILWSTVGSVVTVSLLVAWIGRHPLP